MVNLLKNVAGLTQEVSAARKSKKNLTKKQQELKGKLMRKANLFRVKSSPGTKKLSPARLLSVDKQLEKLIKQGNMLKVREFIEKVSKEYADKNS